MSGFNYSDAFEQRVAFTGSYCDKCRRPMVSRHTLCTACRVRECSECGKKYTKGTEKKCQKCNKKDLRKAVEI